MMQDKSKYTPKFKIPENYFEEFDERVMHTILEGELPKTAGFGVPEGYFDTLTKKIEQQTMAANTATTGRTKVIPLYKRRGFAIAASIAACLAIVFAIEMFNPNTSNLDSIQATAISDYIEDGNLDLTSTDLIPYFQEEDIDALIFGTEEISSESISDYLLNNLDDSTLLTE